MEKTIKMPKLGQTVDEYTVAAVHFSDGDEIEMGDPIIDVETDKALMPVESFADGEIIKILVQKGDVIKDGDGIAVIEAEDE